MNRELITLNDIDSLDFLAEDILHEMRFNGSFYDENGNRLFPNDDELSSFIRAQQNAMRENILEFRECPLFRELSITDIRKLTLREMQETYLAGILPKACAMMRKQASVFVGSELSSEITDAYLRDLFTIRWRDNAMLWIVQIGKRSSSTEELDE